MTITTTKTFLISSRDAGPLGLYEATSEADAHEVLARDAGYRDTQHEADALDVTVEYLRADLTIDEVDLPATIKKIAEEMVRSYRVRGDDLTEADLLDDDGHNADEWDAVGIEWCALDAHVERSLATAIIRQHRDDLREAYVAAWREAVTRDLATAIKAIAKALVDCDRDSSDSDDVRDDAEAGDASGWDGHGIITVAQEAGVGEYLVEAVVGEYLPQIRDAYAVAWREAVALDLAARDDDEA